MLMQTASPWTAYTLAAEFGDDEELVPLLEKLIRRHKTAYKKMTKFSAVTDPHIRWVVEELNLLQAEQEHGEPLKRLETIHRLVTTPVDATPNENRVTDAQIARAREYPITNLIEFRRGFAVCPFHGEKTGSLHLLPNSNETKAHCHGACSKTYDAISAYMLLHNCNFISAVKGLSN